MKLVETYGYKKTIPEEIYFPVLKALSFYPELKDTPIIFRFKKPNGKTIMSAQPVVKTMFGLLVQRAYYVNISRHIKLGSDSLLIEDLPEDVLIGWLGHELGHVMDYHQRSVVGMIWFGLNYWLSKPFVKGAERVADEFAVMERGICNGLHDGNGSVCDSTPVTTSAPLGLNESIPIEELLLENTDQAGMNNAIYLPLVQR